MTKIPEISTLCLGYSWICEKLTPDNPLHANRNFIDEVGAD